MSDIYVKTSTGTSSTTWQKAVNLFVKTTSGSSSATWAAVKNVYVRFSAGWTRVWPVSGVFSITSPYIATSSSSTTPLYAVDGVRRVGSTVWGKNGTWDANGWVINSYQFRWRAYSSSQIIDFNLASQTALATYSGPVSLSIPASYDRQYLSFFIQANSSGGTAYNGYAESGVEYGGLQIVRRQPVNLTKSLNNLSPQVGSTISYSSSWDTSDAYAPEAFRTTIQWYRNLSNSTIGGTLISSGNYSYVVQSSDLNHYIYAVETTYNSGSDYDLGVNNGVEAKVITTSTVTAGLTPPTSVSVSSVSRYSNTETLVVLSHSGGSGPYYQMYWVSSSTTPTTSSYDAASNTSSNSISEAFSFAPNTTYYFYVRSSSENIATTFTNGTATAGTFSSYSNITPQPFYTFQSPSGATSSIAGSTTTGSTLTLTANSPTTAAPAAETTSIAWRVNDGGVGGNSFTGGSVLQSSGTTFVIPQFLYGSVSSVGYQVRAEVTWNNGVGSQTANSNAITITAPLTKLTTPTGVNASDDRSDGVNVTWNAVSGAAYYGVWYGSAPSYDSLADFGGNRNTTLITGTSYLDTSIGTGVARDYYVQAYRTNDPTGTKSDWGGPNSGIRVAAATVPTAPTNLSVTNITSSGATINWSAPTSNGGAAITSYEVNRDGFAFFNVGNVTSYNYTLSAGTYTIGVRAVNSAGSGATATISVTIPTAFVTPVWNGTMPGWTPGSNFQRITTGTANYKWGWTNGTFSFSGSTGTSRGWNFNGPNATQLSAGAARTTSLFKSYTTTNDTYTTVQGVTRPYLVSSLRGDVTYSTASRYGSIQPYQFGTDGNEYNGPWTAGI